jgi:four helix bundle protein
VNVVAGSNGTAAAVGRGVKDHRELICWQLADKLRQLVIAHTGDDSGAAKDSRYTTNLRDAIASACRNQSEGFYKFKHREMRPYFNTARGSLGETLDGIEDGEERGYFSKALAEKMTELCRRAMRANLRFLHSLNRPD